MRKLSFNCSFTFSLSSFRIFVRKHHEFHMQKSYLIMNDLSRMFIEKFKQFDLRLHQNRSYSSQSIDVRQSRFAFSKKSYLIIENLFEMFDEKFRKLKRCYFKIKRTSLSQNSSQNNRELKSTSSLQSIRSRRLVKVQKVQNWKFWINICLRNQFALSSSKICLRNQSIYHIKCSMSSTSIRSLQLFSFSYFFVFFRSFFLFSHSFRSFQLQKSIALTFTNKSFRSLIVLILNLLFRDEIEKRRKINRSII